MDTLEDQGARTRIETSRRNYEEMLEVAQKIHPDMQLRLVGFREDQWEMYMPTTFLDKNELSASYKGSIAWTLYESSDRNYGNSLSRYRQVNGLDGSPLEAAADHVNLSEEEAVWAEPILAKLVEENDAAIIDWTDDIDNEQLIKYTACRNEVANLTREKFADKWEAINLKWGFL